jgi:hypothetical protein
LLNTLLCTHLFHDFEVLVVTKDTDFVLLLGLLILVHRSVLGLLIKRLCDFLWKFHILQDDSSELESLILKHSVEEFEHILGLILTLDLIDFKVCFSACQHTDSFSYSSLYLLVELINTDIVDEILNRFVITLAPENSTDLDLNEDVIKGGARFDIHLKNYVLLSHKVLYLGL